MTLHLTDHIIKWLCSLYHCALL